MKNKLYKLFADCIPVKGFSRSIVYDLTRKNYDYIPNSLYEIIKDGIIDTEIYESLDEDSRLVFEEYLHFLLDKEYVFEILDPTEAVLYPNLDLKFDYPSEISNAIVDYNGDFDLFRKSILQLQDLNCNFLVIRILHNMNYLEVNNLLALFHDSVIFSIDILINYNIDLNSNNLRSLVLDYPRLNIITIFNSPEDEHDHSFLNNGMGHIVYTKKEYLKETVIPIRNTDSFMVNIKLFTESVNFNNFFFKKLYISEVGDVKNTPFSNEVAGNINQTLLIDVINTEDFKRLWYVKKDNIEICKDCEHRYMCVDNRNPVKISGNEYGFSSSCHYNPYTAEWTT